MYERLFVLWSDPATKRRHTVGYLWRETDGRFAFTYAADLAPAMKAGFSLLPEFPSLKSASEPYVSTTLFSTFAQRIPSARRPDYGSLLASWGVEHPEDPLEVLALSGGVQLTDRLELAEYRTEVDDLTRPLVFRVAGDQFYEGGKRLSAGEHVCLRREPDSPFDPCATQVRIVAGDLVGYVPRQYSALVARLLDAQQELDAVAVRKLVLPEDRDRWVVRVQRTAPR